MGRMPGSAAITALSREQIPARLDDAHFFFLRTRGEFRPRHPEVWRPAVPIISDQTLARPDAGQGGDDIPLGGPMDSSVLSEE